MKKKNEIIAVIGLGYVGLPLAVAFGREYSVIGFDVDAHRVEMLRSGRDETLELTQDEIKSAVHLEFTCDPNEIDKATTYIITVPTPVDEFNRPNLDYLLNASKIVGNVLSKGDTVIYESTVYPGATEGDCVPVLERFSGLKYNVDFVCGYSPERVNPGDKKNRLTNIVKITSGSTPEAANQIDQLYSSIISAGTYCAESIRVAEAAKVIENTQRDINIALINELAKIFNKMDVDTEQVLKAAGSKWNFLPFRPGLVGGHCIGVDPYYLTHKAEAEGYYPELILAGRRINNGMAKYTASQMVKGLIRKDISVQGSRVLIMGVTFKEDCPDLRNSKVLDVARELQEFGIRVDAYDPWITSEESHKLKNIRVIEYPKETFYDGIIIAVGHKNFMEMGCTKIKSFCKSTHVIYDLKHVLKKSESDMRL